MAKKLETKINSLKLSRAGEFNNHIKIKKFSGSEKKNSYKNWPEAWKITYYKAYPRFDQIILPDPSRSKFDLYSTLVSRKTCRDFSTQLIKVNQLSDLLYYSIGMKKIVENNSSNNRMYPSAGARYPLEVYLIIFKSEQLRMGVYHYHFKTHSLEVILPEPVFEQAMQQLNQSWIRKAGILIVISAVFERTEMKYKDRGYRHILTEYGHIAQNLYLVSTALGLGVCSIGGFVDDGLNRLLDIDGRIESVIGLIAVGNKKL